MRVFFDVPPQGGIRREAVYKRPKAPGGLGLNLLTQVEAVGPLEVGLDGVPATAEDPEEAPYSPAAIPYLPKMASSSSPIASIVC